MKTAKKIALRIPQIRGLIEERDKLRDEVERLKEEKGLFVSPGHFYSPIPDVDEIKSKEDKIFSKKPHKIPGIYLLDKEQMELLEEFKRYTSDIPFRQHKTEGLCYYFENPAYSYSDAIFLYYMIRHLNPKRIIEVGSGYSSAAMIDVNEIFFENKIRIQFIEPFPELLISLLKKEDKNRYKILDKKLQDVDLDYFKFLKENDILFIDSTHISKTNSDVNYLIFEILPSLNRNVYIHFHDIFYPFEYPKEWVYEGRAWNEAYMIRAFLEYNNSFKIVAFNTYLQIFYREFFEKNMPLCLKDTGGSIWIKKISD